MDLKSLTTPPSILYPLAGAAIGYLLGREEGKPTPGWAIVAGALGGALFNASSKIVDLKSQVAKGSGVSEFKGNVGGEAVAAVLGASDTKAAAPAQATTGPMVRRYIY